MPAVPAPSGLFRVRDPLSEVLQRSAAHLASLPPSPESVRLRELVRDAETLARARWPHASDGTMTAPLSLPREAS
jgi:hypothetical protein